MVARGNGGDGLAQLQIMGVLPVTLPSAPNTAIAKLFQSDDNAGDPRAVSTVL